MMQERQEKFFYGWVIVFGGLFLSLIMYGVVDAFGIVFKPISEEFHWDRGTVSVSSMINWISFGLGNLAFGTLTDRFGSRRVMIGGGIIFVIGTLLMSQIHSVWHLYLFFGVLIAIGRSAAGVPLTALVTRWFTKNQGLALALAQSQNVGSAVFAPLTVFFLAQYGWRGSYIGLGAIGLLIIPLALLMRDHHTTQASASAATSRLGATSANLSGMTLREAAKTRAFWTLNMMVIGCCTCHSCILLHGVNHMTDVGLSATTASHVVAVMAIFGMIGKVANGLLADKVGAKWSMAGFLFLQAITIPLFVHAHEVPTFYMWAVLFGTGFGGPMPVYAMLFREYFGIRNIGSILGVFFMIAAFGMGSGSMMGGLLYNMFGSYAVPFFTSTTTGLIAAFLALTLPPITKREPAVTPQIALAS
jgi:MFS family permease